MSEVRKKKILVVDDEQSVVAYLTALLQDNGYETVSAADGKLGYEMAQREKPDLITLDISMPEESGVRCYRNLKSDPDFASVPVAIVTAVTGYGGKPEEFERFISTRKQVPPPDAFISKPIDQGEFLAAIAKLLS